MTIDCRTETIEPSHRHDRSTHGRSIWERRFTEVGVGVDPRLIHESTKADKEWFVNCGNSLDYRSDNSRRVELVEQHIERLCIGDNLAVSI
jgi:hypothetical protein